MPAYATRRDVYDCLPPGTLGGQGRLLASVAANTNILELEDHALSDGDEVQFRTEAGGTLPAPLVEGTTYFAIRLTSSSFQVATIDGGTPVDLTTAGDNVVVSKELPVFRLICRVSALADIRMPHVVPLKEPYPEAVVDVVSRIVARRLQATSGVTSETVNDFEEQAWKELEFWAKGIPLRDISPQEPSNLAVVATRSASSDPRGWGSSGCLP